MGIFPQVFSFIIKLLVSIGAQEILTVKMMMMRKDEKYSKNVKVKYLIPKKYFASLQQKLIQLFLFNLALKFQQAKSRALGPNQKLK